MSYYVKRKKRKKKKKGKKSFNILKYVKAKKGFKKSLLRLHLK